MNEIGLPHSEIDTPFLWVDLDSLESNISKLAAHFKQANVNWRPHTKGIKTPEIAHMALNAGAIGVTCAKLGEAEVMAAAGIRNILIANQIVTPKKIARLVNLCRRADVKVAVDHAPNVKAVGEAAAAAGVEIGMLVDVNTGMNRTGVEPGAATVALSQLVHQTAGLRYLGLMTWEGHSLSAPDEASKRHGIEASMKLLADSAQLCRDAGLPVEIISGGGSGTSNITPELGIITEIQAGGGIFCDVVYRGWGLITQPSLFVRTTVTSRSAPTRIITDAGFKSLPSWRYTPEAVGNFPTVKSISSSAEHGVFTLGADDDSVKVGDAFDFIVGYGDATVFLHDFLYGIRNGVVEVVWSVVGRGKLR